MRTVILGLPKTGTTYLFSLFAAAMHASGPLVEAFEPNRLDQAGVLHRPDGQSWAITEHILVKAICNAPLKDHGWEVDVARQAFHSFEKKVYIVRDPRDRVVSTFFYHWFYAHGHGQEEFEHAFARVKHKEAHPAALPFHRLHGWDEAFLAKWASVSRDYFDSLSRSIAGLREDGWFVLRYEDLVDGRVQELESFLGLTLESDHEVAPAFQHVSRSKTHGNWRQWFTPEDRTYYEPVFRQCLAAQGYDADDWRLESVERLPSEQASQYMHGLFYHPDGPNKPPWRLVRSLKRALVSR